MEYQETKAGSLRGSRFCLSLYDHINLSEKSGLGACNSTSVFFQIFLYNELILKNSKAGISGYFIQERSESEKEWNDQ